jgi:hypothetical protein
MNSKKKITQLFFEDYYQCTENPSKWINCDFPNYIVSEKDMPQLISNAQADSKNYFFNGLLTFSEAIKGLREGNYSWSVIKFYYSVYYFLRASLYINKIIFIHRQNLYRLELKKDSKPVKKRNRKYNSDHKGTINHYIDLFSETDILLSNQIENMDTYEWLLDKREYVNYKIGKFSEPDNYTFYSYYLNNNFKKNYKELLIAEIEDDFINCFQPETGLLAIPVKRLLATFQEMVISLDLKSVLTVQQYRIIKQNIKDEDLLKRLLS